ncbi:MAG: hypothetical protein ACR2HJ_03990 [Fimbriimonadales bacterium]
MPITNMGSGERVSGICHARGENAGASPQWLIYIAVDDLRASCFPDKTPPIGVLLPSALR